MTSLIITLVTSDQNTSVHKKMDHKTRSRGWCFTVNNYSEDDVNLLSKGGPCPEQVMYICFGKEIASTGTHHLQGYIHTKTVKSFKQIKALVSVTAHLEPRKGSVKQAIDYCIKDGDVTEYGNRPNQGKRTDLEEVANLVVSGVPLPTVAESHPSTYVKYSRGLRDLALTVSKPYLRSDVCGLWIYGEPGTGKSHYAQTKYPNAYRKAQNKWFDGYAGQKEIILDDLDTGALCHHLKIWSDKWSCTGETKGGTVHLCHDLFIVTSNYRISELVPEKVKGVSDEAMIGALCRRFEEIEIKKVFVPPEGPVGPGAWVSVLEKIDGTQIHLGTID